MEETKTRSGLIALTSVKYAIILILIFLIITVINDLTYNPEPSPLSFIVVLEWLAVIVFMGLAHIEYNRKNGHFISFKDAIFIGLIIIAIYFVASAIINFVNFELFLKEKAQLYFSEKYPNSDLAAGRIGGMYFVLSNFFALILNVILLFWLITVEAQWKIFKKAGRKGWESLIPIYNTVIFLQICQKPVWWIILLLIPIVNIIIVIMVYHGLSVAFGKTGGFTAGLLFLPFVFFPLLGLSRLQYQGVFGSSESSA